MLSDGTQRHAYYQSDEVEILNILFPRVGIEPTTCDAHSQTLVPLRDDGTLFLSIVTHQEKLTKQYMMINYSCRYASRWPLLLL